MPRPVGQKESTDLHAPWWSDERDASGRYVEHWSVKKYMTERDQQEISNAQQVRIRTLTGGKSSDRLGADVMGQVIQNQMAFARLYTILQMTVEVTDADGV